jgi:hypothetical protein
MKKEHNMKNELHYIYIVIYYEKYMKKNIFLHSNSMTDWGLRQYSNTPIFKKFP